MSTTELGLSGAESVLGTTVKSAAAVVVSDSERRFGLPLYTNAVMVAGAALLALFAPHAMLVDLPWCVALLVVAIPASLFKVSLQLPGGGATMTLGYAVGFAGLLTVGPHSRHRECSNLDAVHIQARAQDTD